MKKIIGIEERSGVIEGKSWIGYTITIQDDEKKGLGVLCEVYKIKADALDSTCKMYGVTYDKLLGHEIVKLHYDAYKNISLIELK